MTASGSRNESSRICLTAPPCGSRICRKTPPTAFEITPDKADALAALAAELGVNALRKLRFAGEIKAMGKKDWKLAGRLGATVVQDCVVTLEPVTTRHRRTGGDHLPGPVREPGRRRGGNARG